MATAVEQTLAGESPRATAEGLEKPVRRVWYLDVRWLQLGLAVLVLGVYGRVVGLEALNHADNE